MGIIYLADVFEARFNKLASFFACSGNLRDVLVILEVDQVRVYERVADASSIHISWKGEEEAPQSRVADDQAAAL